MKKQLSQIYEEISKALGHKDWNTLCGLIPLEEREKIKSFVKYAKNANNNNVEQRNVID